MFWGCYWGGCYNLKLGLGLIGWLDYWLTGWIIGCLLD